MSYRKQISYLELRENGQRIRNVGYAKLESLDKKYIFTLQINGVQAIEGRKVQLYLQKETGEELLCEPVVSRGEIACRREEEQGKNNDEIQGVRVLINKNKEITGHFTKPDIGKKLSKSSVEKTDMISEGAQEIIAKEEEIPETVPKVQEQAAIPNRTENKVIIKAEHADAVSQESKNVLQMKDTKWEQLSSIYPHIHPFRDTREFLSVGPEDFVVLRERCYQMTHNSFLLHGYYNYRHLLLMRQEKSNQILYYIGVPGNFYEREKQVARMFGFESFEGTREPAWEGDFGYYMIPVEL